MTRQREKRSRNRVQRLLLAMLLPPLLLVGRGGVTLTGVVQDDRGGAVRGAKVTLVNQDTHRSLETISDENGQLGFPDLPPGKYALKAEASGFELQQKLLVVGAEDPEPLNFKLKVGVVRQELAVKGDPADEVSTSESSVASTRLDDEDLVRRLPTPSDDVGSLIGKFVLPAAQGAEGASVVVDGVEGGQVDVPAAAIRRLRINRSPFSAAFQRPGSGRAEISSKRGHKSRYEGSLGMSAGNSLFDARNAFARSTPDLDRRFLQAKLGGWLPGRRASFYVAAERLREDESAVVNAVTLDGPLVANVPTSQRRERVFTRLQWWPTELQTLYAIYGFRDESRANKEVGGFNLPEQGVSTGEQEHKVALGYSAMFSGTARNDLLLSLKQEDDRTGHPAAAPALAVNRAFTGGPSQSFGRKEQRSFDLVNTATLIRGRNSLLFGGRFRTDRRDVFDASNFAGTFEFASLTQFAARAPFAFRVNQGDPNIAFGVHQASGFWQDEIRTRPDLTLTFGLRYDWQSTTGGKFAPRFAFAFAPGKERKTALRGGMGIFYDTLPRTATERSLLFDGARLREVVISNPSFPDPFLGGRVISPPPSAVRVAPDIRAPYLLHAGIGVERELWHRNSLSLDYLFFRGVRLFRSRDINAPLAAGPRPDPSFLNINQVESTAFLRSHALAVTFSGRIGKFFKPYAKYVLSRNTDNTSGTFSLPANNYDLRPETGPGDFDRRHRLDLMAVVELPRGLRLGTVLSAGSGTPFNITTGFDGNGDTVANDRPAGVTRNTGRGPGTMELDLRLTKTFEVSRLWRSEQSHGRRHTLEYSVDAFNATNRTNVSHVVGVLSSPFFGRANAAEPARRLQFSVRYVFPE